MSLSTNRVALGIVGLVQAVMAISFVWTLLFYAPGCTDSVSSSEITLVVEADATVTRGIDSVQIRVFPGRATDLTAPRFRHILPAPVARPGGFTVDTLLVGGPNEELLVVVDGMSAGESHITRTVKLQFIPGIHQRAGIALGKLCMDALPCDDLHETCFPDALDETEGGHCGPVHNAESQVFRTTDLPDASSRPQDLASDVDAGDASTLPMTPEIPAESSTETLAPELPPGYVACGKAGMCPQSFPCLETDEGGYACAGRYADWPIPNGGVAGGRPASYAVLSNGDDIRARHGPALAAKYPKLLPGLHGCGL
jgi:hypothetical protein